MTEPNYTLGYSVLAFTKKFLQSLYIYIYIYMYISLVFPCCSVWFFLSMIGNILWRWSGWWKNMWEFSKWFSQTYIHTYKVNIPMFHPAYSDFLNSICPWEKCRTIHRFSYRKNVKRFATGDMFRDVSNKKISA